ncbi:MAG: membrane protein [Gemmatimonadota bacterium]|nr:MAG: membrane protein [Gemmatimonadota bacterium]
MNRRLLTILTIVTLVVGSSACTNKQKGGTIGAGAGAAIGGLIGNANDNTAMGAIIGAAVGGAAGVYIGHYMDKQVAEMEADLEGAKIERVGEGIKITFDSGILFDVNKAALRPAAQENLAQLAGILGKYDDTNILIEGHTDSTGSDEHNLELSKRRAQSVANYLIGQQVATARMSMQGWGEDMPVGDNDTEYGRQQNRRVELAIWANDDLKKVAEKKAG